MNIKSKIKALDFPIVVTIIFVIIIGFSIFVRSQGLGYSGFQGDEVNPMTFMYEGMDKGFLNYLLSQKRGPMQYVINYANVSSFGYHGEALIRLPYLIFGILALFTFYKLAEKIFKDDKTTAFLTTVLIAINGLFIAFARITQYQSFMYFLVPIGVYVFIKALEKKDIKKFILAGLLMSVAFLAHMDTMSVTPFFLAGFLASFIRDLSTDGKETKVKKLILNYLKMGFVFFAFFLVPALAFYIPFSMGQNFSDTTSGYLEGRLFGGGFMPRTGITLKLITMYVPALHLYFLFLTGLLGIIYIGKNLDKIKILKLNLTKKHMSIIFLSFIVLLGFAVVFSLYPIKPRMSSLLVLGSSLMISLMLILAKKVDWKQAALVSWFLAAFSFYFFVMKDPRTHIYVSLIPLFAISAYGLVEFYRSIRINWVKYLYLNVLTLSFVLICGVNFVIFVDKSPEYPWWDKNFMGREIYRIKRVRHEKIEGVFGFNNYRGWDQVADLYKRGCLTGSFNSNEKDSITYFYIRQTQKKGDLWELTADSDTLIIVEGPHSWIYYSKDKVPSDYSLLHTIESKGIPVTYIYGRDNAYPEGKLLCN